MEKQTALKTLMQTKVTLYYHETLLSNHKTLHYKNTCLSLKKPNIKTATEKIEDFLLLSNTYNTYLCKRCIPAPCDLEETQLLLTSINNVKIILANEMPTVVKIIELNREAGVAHFRNNPAVQTPAAAEAWGEQKQKIDEKINYLCKDLQKQEKNPTEKTTLFAVPEKKIYLLARAIDYHKIKEADALIEFLNSALKNTLITYGKNTYKETHLVLLHAAELTALKKLQEISTEDLKKECMKKGKDLNYYEKVQKALANWDLLDFVEVTKEFKNKKDIHELWRRNPEAFTLDQLNDLSLLI